MKKGLGGVGSLNAIPTRYQRSIHAALTPRWHVHVYCYCKCHEIDEIVGIAVAQQFQIPTTRASAFSAIDSSWDRDIKSKHQPARCTSCLMGALHPHVPHRYVTWSHELMLTTYQEIRSHNLSSLNSLTLPT